MSTSEKRLTVGCVADNTAKYLQQALRLLQSWRWFAGGMKDAEFHVCVVDEIPKKYIDKFEHYGARVHVVPRFSTLHPPSNKLRFLELPECQSADWVLLLDCDTVIVQDPSACMRPGADFAAKPADFSTVPHDTFRKLFSAFDLPLPAQDLFCTVCGTPTIPYFNAGVLAFSRDAVRTLVPQWIELNRQVIDHLELLGEHANFCEQASLSLALVKCGTSIRVMGNEMNFPGHCTDLPLDSGFGQTDPVIVHYHWLVDENGYLLCSPYAQVDARIREFNARLKVERNQHVR